jgi:hypothetical protein
MLLGLMGAKEKNIKFMFKKKPDGSRVRGLERLISKILF